MNIHFLKEEKNEIELEIDNLTIAELLRSYLNKDESVTLAAWRREHPSKNPQLIVQTKDKTAKKALSDAVSKIEKDLSKAEEEFKTSK